MYKITKCVFFFVCLISTALFTQTIAQSAHSAIVGNWKGTITYAGKSLPTIIHIKDSAGILQATMDSPNQVAFGIPCQGVIFKADSLYFNIQHVISYRGKLTAKDLVTGTFTQAGLHLPLNLSKSKDSSTAIIRPQTPKPPFPYISKEIIYKSPDGKQQFGATITMPDSTGKFPAILLITGSGKQNRDEEIFKHRPFAVIADNLTRAGYMVMRVDDRGAGKSTGKFEGATTLDFAKDAQISLDYLKELPQTDQKKLGLLGHSEGGIIAEMIAAKRKDLDFIILMAAPGIPSFHLQELQRIAATKKMMPSISEEALKYDSTVFHYAVGELLVQKDTALARKTAMDSLKVYFKKHPNPVFTSQEQRLKNAEKSVPAFIQLINKDPWMMKWLSLDATSYLKNISCKVLALNGGEDFQVTPMENLAGIKAALTTGGCKDFEIKELPGLNHLFQHCNTCTLAEYATLEVTLDPSFLSAVKDWLEEKVPADK